jgi:hypothetical protein
VGLDLAFVSPPRARGVLPTVGRHLCHDEVNEGATFTGMLGGLHQCGWSLIMP